MSANPLLKLPGLGQSIWYDNISRDIIDSGELQKMIDQDNLRGVTSNPSIFQKAVSGSNAYDNFITKILNDNPDIDIKNLYERIVIEDIQDGADLLQPVYHKTSGLDGYISLEVSPDLAYDTEGTVAEAKRLYDLVNRPNLMIKVPATREGIPAVRQLTGDGICINVTLMFSMKDYENVVDAYLSGLEDRLEKGLSLENIASVASFFVSRVDTLTDKKLKEKNNTNLLGKSAVANSKLVYQRSLEIYRSDRFKQINENGGNKQRLLWASTSTKNPDYPDTLYVDELIGSDTVNTIPPATMNAYRDHGNPQERLTKNIEQAQSVLQQIRENGIDLDQITSQLQKDGVQAFADAFNALLDEIARKKEKLTGVK